MTQPVTRKKEPTARREANRSALVAALRERLLCDGLPGLSFEKIAETAGMTRRSVYNHFGSRAGLMEALMDDIGARAGVQGLARVWQVEAPDALLEAYFAELCRMWEADRDMFRLMVGLSAADPELGRAVLARVGRVREAAKVLADRLDAQAGRKPGWSRKEAFASLFALSVFPTYDAIRDSGISQAAAARRMAQMARAPFEL
ncbi:MAG: hypothetical protein CR993_07655 [Rhodobacterales bacterium]|nr:MAG: hypothetical protein CR993_07655 [Rhodobacterales bacterium]